MTDSFLLLYSGAASSLVATVRPFGVTDSRDIDPPPTHFFVPRAGPRRKEKNNARTSNVFDITLYWNVIVDISSLSFGGSERRRSNKQAHKRRKFIVSLLAIAATIHLFILRSVFLCRLKYLCLFFALRWCWVLAVLVSDGEKLKRNKMFSLHLCRCRREWMGLWSRVSLWIQ